MLYICCARCSHICPTLNHILYNTAWKHLLCLHCVSYPCFVFVFLFFVYHITSIYFYICHHNIINNFMKYFIPFSDNVSSFWFPEGYFSSDGWGNEVIRHMRKYCFLVPPCGNIKRSTSLHQENDWTPCTANYLVQFSVESLSRKVPRAECVVLFRRLILQEAESMSHIYSHLI